MSALRPPHSNRRFQCRYQNSSQPALSIVYQAVDSLKPRSTNPRTHSKKQIGQIASAIRRFGFTNPVLVDDANGIVAGHGRVEAAKAVGLDQVPTVRLSAMSEAEIRAYVIADNRLAENAGWDRELLGLELKYLTDLDIDFDVTLTGFELPEIDLLIGELSLDGDNDPADAVVEVAAGPAVTRPGDIWRIGGHRLICGDFTRSETYQALLGEQRAQLVFTDPPYNVPISGHVGGLGAVQHREFAMASGDVASRIYRLPADRIRPSRGLFCRRLDSFSVHGLAPSAGDADRRQRRVYRPEEPLRLVQEQRRHGFAVPVAA